MNDFTIILLCIACPLVICALVGVEIYFITRYTRKTAILNQIRTSADKYFKHIFEHYVEMVAPAILYGTPIEIAIKNNSIYLINDGKFFAINIDDFTSITYKNGKYIFRLTNLAIANTKVFAIKCDDDRLLKHLNIAMPDSQEETTNPKSIKEFLSTSTNRFVLVGIVYAIFFIIFALTGNALYYVIMTVLFAAGLTIYIVHHYVTNLKTLTEGTKSEILEKREKQKLFYGKVIAVCLGIVIVITLLCAIPTNNNNDDYDPYECFWCNGTGMAEDAYGKLHYCSHCHGSGRQ
ncbi:MAG: hypothetical protein E7659_06715 [Ruminococcaceae bacterium]|nr:hypothetical protein [Oscillospiraceae bacterium]